MNFSLFFHVWTATDILQFSRGTVSRNFVWLSHSDLSLTTNLLVSFCFIQYPYLVWTATSFFLFFWVKLPHFSLCECHTNVLCVSIIFVWMSHRYPCVSITSKWILHYVSFWVITDPFSFLSCVDCQTSFLKWKLHLSYLFSQFWQYNEFISNNFSYFECNNTFTIAWSFSFGFCDSSTRAVLALVPYEIRFSMFHSFNLLQPKCLISWLLLNGHGRVARKFSKFIRILNDLKP